MVTFQSLLPLLCDPRPRDNGSQCLGNFGAVEAGVGGPTRDLCPAQVLGDRPCVPGGKRAGGGRRCPADVGTGLSFAPKLQAELSEITKRSHGGSRCLRLTFAVRVTNVLGVLFGSGKDGSFKQVSRVDSHPDLGQAAPTLISSRKPFFPAGGGGLWAQPRKGEDAAGSALER